MFRQLTPLEKADRSHREAEAVLPKLRWPEEEPASKPSASGWIKWWAEWLDSPEGAHVILRYAAFKGFFDHL